MVIENYGSKLPKALDEPAPGTPVKYLQVSALNLSFVEAEISIKYNASELGDIDENSLNVYHYNRTEKAWNSLKTKINAKDDILTASVDSLSIFAVSTGIQQQIEILDTHKIPVISDIKTYDEARTLKKEAKTSRLSTDDVPEMGELEVDALASKNMSIRLKANKMKGGKIILEDYGKKNPVSVPLPGRAVKYVEIGAKNISFSSADITIRYTDAELNGGNEYDLTIYHWNGAAWDALPTTVDMAYKTLSASTTSLSPFGVATSFIYYFENNATVGNVSVGADGTTNYSASTTVISVIPYKNLMKNGTMGTAANISYTISANATYKITWRTLSSQTDIVNVSLIVYDPVTGAKTVIGSAQNTTNGAVNSYDPYYNTMNNPNYTVPAGSRLMVQINTTATVAQLKRLQFNDAVSSYITLTETNLTGVGGAAPNINSWGNNKTNNNATSISINVSELVKFNATNSNGTSNSIRWNVTVNTVTPVRAVNLSNISALTSTTTAGTNATYFLNLTNNGTAADTYTITISNPNLASTAATNITSDRLSSRASKVFTLNVTHTSSGTFRVNVTATSGNDASKFGYINTTTTVTAIGGGPGCLGCHNTTSPQNYSGMHYIDGGNFSKSTHANLNSNNASGYGVNASCWACHNSTGTVVPDNTHPDRKTDPFVCTDCHLANGSRAGAYNATIVSNHFKNATGIRALYNRTGDIDSCIGCHENVSSMLLPNKDNDTGSFAGDMINNNGGNTSAYHYAANMQSFGKSKGSNDYCIYCHRNGTGVFNRTFMYASNSSISNHSMRYNASNPSCGLVQCHNSTGETLHGSSLIMPGAGYNSSYCLNCHGLNSSSGTTNYSGMTTGTKNKHNNSVNCEECHMNDGKDIHPVKYLQPDGIFNTSNSTAATCVLCHQTGIANFSNAPGIPSMHHSDDISKGSRWNLTEAYWTNTSQQSMCNYCHGDSRHSENALGRPANWSGLNIINSSIANNSNWCSSCHYQGYTSGAMNYNNMVLTFEGENMPVPPEISNYSSFAPYSKNGYFNHTLTPDYSDSTCKECHGVFLPNSTRMDGFMHNVSTGSGTCTGCHYSYSYMSTLGAEAKFVNQSMYNSSAHGSLECEDCHSYQHDPINDRDRHNITGTPAENVVNNTDCTSCHDTGLVNNATAQYGYGKTYDCNYCHTYPDKTYS